MLAKIIEIELPKNQQHLLYFWDSLDEQQRQSLKSQIQSIDFDLIERLFADNEKATDWNEVASRAQAPDAYRWGIENRFSQIQATRAGSDALAAGKLGVILVAGGQGSRLGFAHPKGMYPIGPLSHRTLFQFHIEQLRAVANRYGVSIPLYLMTSPVTHQETSDFLVRHNRFGLAEADLRIFCQGTMPAVDAKTGELLLASPGEIFVSPDGHGGTLAALEESGCLDDLETRGIEQLYYFQVDNPLVEICQPELLGYHLLSKSELTTQVVYKTDPMEKVGNVVTVNGNMMVIEYSDLPAEHADRRDETGESVFWAGNIAVHVFDIGFLRRASMNSQTLPFHRASKVVPFVNEAGQTVTPSTSNAFKFERFIFDLMPWAKNPIAVAANASDVFAPLKNASGVPKDTPESTREAIVAKHRRILEAAGATVRDGVRIEVNSLFALDADQLREKITESFFISEDQYFEA